MPKFSASEEGSRGSFPKFFERGGVQGVYFQNPKWRILAKNYQKWAKNFGVIAKMVENWQKKRKKAENFPYRFARGKYFRGDIFAKFSTPDGGFWPTPPLGHPCFPRLLVGDNYMGVLDYK